VTSAALYGALQAVVLLLLLLLLFLLHKQQQSDTRKISQDQQLTNWRRNSENFRRNIATATWEEAAHNTIVKRHNYSVLHIYVGVNRCFFVPIGKWRFCPTGKEQTVVSLREVSRAIQMLEMVPLQWKQLKKHCDRVRDIEIMTLGQKTWHIYSMNCKGWDSSK